MVTCDKFLAKIGHVHLCSHYLLLYLAVLKFLTFAKYRVSIR